MKRALILSNNTDKYLPITNSLSDNDISVSVCSYKELCFFIDSNRSSIVCGPSGEDIKNFSTIIILATSPNHLQNYIFSALACYCRKYNITLRDNSFSNTDGKLYALWRFWEKDIPIAKTAFGPTDFMVKKLANLGGKGILKSVQGTKGLDSYMIDSAGRLRQILDENPEKRFVLQNFIPNQGDWRIILIDYRPKMAIYRSSHGKDYRNNTSVGGEAKIVPLEEVNPKILELSIAASKALDIKIAGADIMQDDQTKEYTVLEVNRTPQLVTGAFIDEKREIIRNLIHS